MSSAPAVVPVSPPAGLVEKAKLITDAFIDKLRTTAVDAKRRFFFQRQAVLSDPELEALFDGDWLAQRIVSAVPDQALKGIKLMSEGQNSDELLEAWQKVDTAGRFTEGAFANAARMGRLFAGAGLVLGLDASSEDELLTPIPEPGKQPLLWLDVVYRQELQVDRSYDDIASPKHGQPEIFRITGSHPRTGLRLHASRVVLFEGAPRATRMIQKVPDFGWQSVLQAPYNVMTAYGLAWQNVSHLIGEASIGVLTMKGLIDLLAQQDQAVIETRLALHSEGRSSHRTIFLDADAKEGFDRKSVSFQDLPQLMQQMALTVSAASQIPVTVLMGQAPAGLQATGEGDFRNWHATLKTHRDRSYQPKLQRVASYALGRPVSVSFAPLWQPTEVEEADRRLKLLQGDREAWQMNVVSSQEIRDSRGPDGTLGLDVEAGSKAPATGISENTVGA